MNKIQLSYLAGFFDGEGSITIHENGKPSPRGKNPNHTLQISIGNTDPRILKLLKSLFGGSLIYRKSSKPHHRNVAQWNIRAANTLPFLKAIRPYVKMKRKQVDLAIAFQLTKKMGGPKAITKKIVMWRERQRVKIRELNAYQWIDILRES